MGEEGAGLTTSVDSHCSMSSIRQAWVTGIWREGQRVRAVRLASLGPTGRGLGQLPTPGTPPSCDGASRTCPASPSPAVPPGWLLPSCLGPQVLPAVPGCGQGGGGASRLSRGWGRAPDSWSRATRRERTPGSYGPRVRAWCAGPGPGPSTGAQGHLTQEYSQPRERPASKAEAGGTTAGRPPTPPQTQRSWWKGAEVGRDRGRGRDHQTRPGRCIPRGCGYARGHGTVAPPHRLLHRGGGLRAGLGQGWGPGASHAKCVYSGRIQLEVRGTDSGIRETRRWPDPCDSAQVTQLLCPSLRSSLERVTVPTVQAQIAVRSKRDEGAKELSTAPGTA